MSYSVGELTNRFHLLRLTELLVDGAALRHVAGDLCKADQDAVVVPYGVDDRIRPEPRPILAHPPTLRLESSFLGGHLQRPVRQSVLLILCTVENRKVLTDNLFGPIALDALCASVPV